MSTPIDDTIFDDMHIALTVPRRCDVLMRCSTRWTQAVVATALLVMCLAAIYFKMVKNTTLEYSHFSLINETTAENGEEKIRSLLGRRNDTHAGSKPSKTPPPSSATWVMGMDLENLDRDKALVLGHRRKDKGFLTIGIPYTSQPEDKNNLKRTLESLIQNTQGESERSRETIVVFTSALDQSSRQNARDIVSSFPEHVQSGMLQLIEAPKSFYPANLTAPQGQGGSPNSEQVKRCIEGAFLLAYAMDNSDYYLQLADNVKASPNYVQSIREFILRQGRSYWVILDFSPGGFTGALFRAGGRDLQQLIHLLVTYNKHKPIEQLYHYFRALNIQKEIIRRPALFESW